MPGGLTRVSTSLDNMVVSMQSGGGSKDTWVLGEGPAPPFTLLRPATHPLEVSRATFDLPSRVADNLFWLGRYAERVEAGRAGGARHPAPLLPGRRLVARGGAQCRAGYSRRRSATWASDARAGAAERDVLAMIYDPAAPNGLVANIHQVRRVAWLLRDRISVDAWLILNQLDQQFSSRPPAEAMQVGAAQDLLNHAVITLSAFGGLVMESMTRGDGWRFLDIGRRLERAAANDRAAAQQPGPRIRRTMSESSKRFSKSPTAPSPTVRAI